MVRPLPVAFEQFAERCTERCDISFGEVPGKILPHAFQIHGRGYGERLTALGGDHRVGDPAVALATAPVDQSRRLHPVDESGRAALAEQQELRQVQHPKPTLFGARQPHQNLVPGDVDPALSLELRLERIEDGRVCLDKVQPRPQAFRPAGRGLHAPRLTGQQLTTQPFRAYSHPDDCESNYLAGKELVR